MTDMDRFAFFVGIDWGTEAHQVCVLDAQGQPLGERQVVHSAAGLEALLDWLAKLSDDRAPSAMAIALEVPRGPLVETLLERGLTVFSLNPKQLDRFRDRYFPAGAKDDRRDALVLASALRTDGHCFRLARRDATRRPAHPSTAGSLALGRRAGRELPPLCVSVARATAALLPATTGVVSAGR